MTGCILVAYDYSPAAQAALAHANAEAQATGRPLVVLHVLPLPIPMEAATAVPYPGSGDLARAREELTNAVERAGFHATCVTTVGTSVGVAVLATAKERDASAIVVGTRGHGVVRRALLGSVADVVARHATIPVTIVHAPPRVPNVEPIEDEPARERIHSAATLTTPPTEDDRPAHWGFGLGGGYDEASSMVSNHAATIRAIARFGLHDERARSAREKTDRVPAATSQTNDAKK